MPETILVETRGRGFTDITAAIADAVERAPVADGVAHIFIQHTSASLIVQENADPDVLRDLADYFEKIAPEGDGYRHSAEGRDDMPAHIRSALTLTSLTIPVEQGRLMLGIWQGVYVFEHRRAPHTRKVIITLTNSAS